MNRNSEIVLKIYRFLDDGYLVPEIAEELNMTEERIWQIIEDVEKDDMPEPEIPRRHANFK